MQVTLIFFFLQIVQVFLTRQYDSSNNKILSFVCMRRQFKLNQIKSNNLLA